MNTISQKRELGKYSRHKDWFDVGIVAISCTDHNRLQEAIERIGGVNLVNDDGFSLIHAAVVASKPTMVSKLLDYYHADPCVIDGNGRTALELCESLMPNASSRRYRQLEKVRTVLVDRLWNT